MVPVLIRGGTFDIAIEADQYVEIIPVGFHHAEVLLGALRGLTGPIKGRFSSVTVRYKDLPYVPIRNREDE